MVSNKNTDTAYLGEHTKPSLFQYVLAHRNLGNNEVSEIAELFFQHPELRGKTLEDILMSLKPRQAIYYFEHLTQLADNYDRLFNHIKLIERK